MRHPLVLGCLGAGALFALSACENMNSTDEVMAAASGLGRDSCGAVSHQWLVGNSASQLRVTELPRGTQVIFPGMQVPQISNPKRMTVIVGNGDEVSRVYCG